MNKSQIIDISIIKFFSNDILNLNEYPDEDISSHFKKYPKYMIIDTTVITNQHLRNEYKNLIKCIFVNNIPYKYKSNIFRYFTTLPGFLEVSKINSISDLNMSHSNDLKAYYNGVGLNYERSILSILNTLPKALEEFYDERVGYERDLWRMENLSINPERIDASKSKFDLDFRKISNLENRELVKKWVKYLLGCTEQSYSTIINHFTLLYQFCIFIDGLSLLHVKHDNVIEYMQRYSSMSSNYYNRNLLSIKAFYEYLSIKDYELKEIVVLDSDLKNDDYRYKIEAIDDNVIFQLFNHIHLLPEHLKLIFLIDYCTGIRISDICQLKTDCLFKDSKDGFYLKHNVQKLQNFNAIPIPMNLYNIIDGRIKRLKNENPDQVYLFTAETNKDKPYKSQYYSKIMKSYVKKWGIKNNDGTEFKFNTHAFRHTIATELFKNGMSVEMIQIGVLHHKSINMSMFYIERDENYQNMIKDQYLDFQGNSSSIKNIIITDAALPNGVCGMPLSLGGCPNNVCMDCQFFRTSHKFLDTHKQELEYINKQIEHFQANNLKNNLHTAIKQKEKLELIIKKLEEIKEVKINGNEKLEPKE